MLLYLPSDTPASTVYNYVTLTAGTARFTSLFSTSDNNLSDSVVCQAYDSWDLQNQQLRNCSAVGWISIKSPTGSWKLAVTHEPAVDPSNLFCAITHVRTRIQPPPLPTPLLIRNTPATSVWLHITTMGVRRWDWWGCPNSMRNVWLVTYEHLEWC